MGDTKRGAGAQVVSIAGHAFTVGEVREMLREQGLHLVTAADKAVLDAMKDSSVARLEELIELRPASALADACRAELARRDAAK